MFSLLIGDAPLTYAVGSGEGILQVNQGGTPPLVEYCYILDIQGNQLLDERDYELTAKCGRIYQLYSDNEYRLADLEEFLLGVRS